MLLTLEVVHFMFSKDGRSKAVVEAHVRDTATAEGAPESSFLRQKYFAGLTAGWEDQPSCMRCGQRRVAIAVNVMWHTPL